MSNTAGCFGKIGYATRAAADRAKRHLLGSRGYNKIGGGRSASVMNVYACSKCDRYHLGRDKRAGLAPCRKTADHHAGSFKARKARYRELTEG